MYFNTFLRFKSLKIHWVFKQWLHAGATGQHEGVKSLRMHWVLKQKSHAGAEIHKPQPKRKNYTFCVFVVLDIFSVEC